MKSLKTLNNIVITNDLISKLAKVYRFQGKDFFYKEILKNDLDTIVEQTIEKDVYFLSLILDLKVSEHRMRLILKNKTIPRTVDEEKNKSFQDMFSIIQNKTNTFDLISNEITSLHKKLYPSAQSDSVVYSKSTKEDIELGFTDKINSSKRNIMDDLLQNYNSAIDEQLFERLLIISSLYIDFINIKPYTKNNDIVGLLILYILILKNKFEVFKYVSFFELIYLKNEEWNNAKLQSSFNWSSGFPQVISIYRYLLDFLIMGYEKVEEIVDHYDFDSKLNKGDNIENTISKLSQIFTKDEIRNEHPYVSESTINRTLKRLRDEERIRPLGTGRSAKWIKIQSPIMD